MKKKLFVLMLAVILCLAFTACGDEFKSYRPIEDINNLDMRKIGVQMGSSTDYYISDRDDCIVFRYNDLGALVLSLSYQRIDAMLIDGFGASFLKQKADGISFYDDIVYEDDLCYVIAENKPEILDDFNNWLKDYKKTDEYDEWYDHVRDLDYEYPGITGDYFKGTGKEVVIGCFASYYPASYMEPDGTLAGYEIELLIAFCNDMNYKVTVIASDSEADHFEGIKNGMYDILAVEESRMFVEKDYNGSLLFTDYYVSIPMYLVEAGDRGKIEIKDDFFNY